MNGFTLLIGALAVAAVAVVAYSVEARRVRVEAVAAAKRARRARCTAEFRRRLAAIPDLERPGVGHGISAVRGGRSGGVVPDVRAICPRTVTTDGLGWPHR